MSYFKQLNEINVNEFVEKKNGLTYLSWAHAWKELKKLYPYSFYTVYQNDHEWNYFTDGKTCWVKTGVTVVTEDGGMIEHVEYLPVMDYKNKSIALEDVTSFDVNKAIQRSLTKAVARHGLGLYIYAGEDLPNESEATAEERKREREALEKKITEGQAKTLTEFAKEIDVSIESILKHFKIEKVEDMTVAQYGTALNKLKATKDAKDTE